MMAKILLGEVSIDSSVHVPDFYDFVNGPFAEAFPQYRFDYWHIQLLCEAIEDALKKEKNVCAILPRYHLKSTICGYAFALWRMAKLRQAQVLYLSYKMGMADYHISEIKNIVRNSKTLSSWFKDLAPQAEHVARYKMEGQRANIMPGGVFSFKRGIHVNAGVVTDDILSDPANPLTFTQIKKVENHFFSEIYNIPLRGAPIILVGTPMVPGDLFTILADHDDFIYIKLPARNPDKEHELLCPEVYDDAWLRRRELADPKAFATEFMLVPLLDTESYFTFEEITRLMDPKLKRMKFDKKEFDCVSAGLDVGKKRHPSHITVLGLKDGEAINIYQEFWDRMDYVEQVERLKWAEETFGIDKGMIDNTRGELEERGLSNIWEFVVMTRRREKEMATAMERRVADRTLRLIDDGRFKSQILCVDNNFKAPVTPMGHGDSFFSLGLACLAMEQLMPEYSRVRTVGNVSEMFQEEPPKGDDVYQKLEMGYNKTDEICPFCGRKFGVTYSNDFGLSDKQHAVRAKCLICLSEWSL